MEKAHAHGGHPATVAIAASGTKDTGITVSDLGVAYNGRLALEGVSAEFAPGSLTAIVGPNGAGKSTLLKALAGLVALRTGRVECCARAGNRLAYLPQQAGIDRSFPVSVGALVALGGWRTFGAFAPAPATLAARVSAAVAQVGLGGQVDRPIAALSVGELQRALFARLLLQDAPVILLDEPFAAVDAATTQDLLALIRRLHGEGRTLVAVLHDLDQVRENFPQTLLLARRVIAWGKTGDVLTPDNLALARAALQSRQGARS